VVFMDSTGLALLINARRRMMRRGHGFAIVCPAGPIARVFEIADMVERLRVCPDRESARLAATRVARA
jgi:anti-sigma B factor antagonist